MSALLSLATRSDIRALHLLSAAVGCVVWLLSVVVLMPGWAEALVLLAPLVIVPLALALVAPRPADPSPYLLLGWAVAYLQFPCALILAVSFALRPGPLAGCLSVPWFAFTLLIALLGLLRLRSHVRGPIEDISIDAGLIFLAVGGLWTTLSRWGVRPMNFGEPIVLLTGAHFHYAGLVLPMLTGLAGRQWKGIASQLAALGVLAGVPLVAVGINLSPHGFQVVEWLAAWLLAAAGLLVAILHLRLMPSASGAIQQMLLLICSISLGVGMILAAIYALGTFRGHGWLSIPVMVYTHGVLNSLGFALLGLLAWNRMAVR